MHSKCIDFSVHSSSDNISYDEFYFCFQDFSRQSIKEKIINLQEIMRWFEHEFVQRIEPHLFSFVAMCCVAWGYCTMAAGYTGNRNNNNQTDAEKRTGATNLRFEVRSAFCFLVYLGFRKIWIFPKFVFYSIEIFWLFLKCRMNDPIFYKTIDSMWGPNWIVVHIFERITKRQFQFEFVVLLNSF